MSTATVPRRAGGLIDSVSSTDHKRVGVHVMMVSGVFFFLGGMLALTMRSELARPGLQYVSTETYDQLFTIHGSTMVFLVMTPLAVALGAYLVPLQIGAADLIAPRLNLFAVWLLIAGGVIMYSGFLTAHGAASAGWTEFLPVAGRTYAPGPGTDLWAIGVFLATVAVIIIAATIALTVFLRRAPGMTMMRLPIFTWAMLATCFLIVFGFPVLPAVLVILEVQRHSSLTFSPIVYQELFWFYGHPAVYVMFFPFLGAVVEVVSVFSQRRLVGYTPLVVTLLAFNATSMTVWAHHMFTTGHVFNEYFALTSTLLLVFAGVEYFDVVATMWGGVIRFDPPMLFALGFLLQFVIGGVTGIVLASPPLDYHLNDSYFVVAHFHYTLFAGSLFGGLAALYYWYPKITGRMLDRRLGVIQFWVLVVGTNLTFFPQFILGYRGMARRVADYPAHAGLTTLNELSTLGAFVTAVAMLVLLWNLVTAPRRAIPAGDDPWNGHTLEWWTSSPPPRHNFDSLPAIESAAPLLDLAESRGEVT